MTLGSVGWVSQRLCLTDVGSLRHVLPINRPSSKPICDQQFLGEAQSPEY
ncbi:hypothetical protein [Cardinium endosymbiont of Dermatophagoides farinae]|nr:hypothetical protein [Cardinium endosymbiont of Dermatophagoides farinae]